MKNYPIVYVTEGSNGGIFMYCANCNKSFTDEYSFCDTCGGKLEKENGTEASQPVTPQPTTYSQPEYQPTPTYQAPPAAPVYAPQTTQELAVNDKQSKTVSFGAWIGIIFINIIPFTFGVLYTILAIVATLTNLDNLTPVSIAFFAFALFYIVLLFVWAFGKPKARSLKNYAKATLIMTIIVILIVVISAIVLGDYIMDLVPEEFNNFNFDMNF